MGVDVHPQESDQVVMIARIREQRLCQYFFVHKHRARIQELQGREHVPGVPERAERLQSVHAAVQVLLLYIPKQHILYGIDGHLLFNDIS